MTDIAKITTAVSPLEEVDKINEVIQRANENTSAIALLEGAPTGSVMPYAGSTAPTGWLICDGSAISRTTYADLFAVIGTTYGAGDGSTTFNLPNFPTQKIITGDFGCKGNGIAMGWTDGTNNFVFRGFTNNQYNDSKYGKNVGTSGVNNKNTTSDVLIGLTTDSTKSGIITDTSGFTSVNVCIKF